MTRAYRSSQRGMALLISLVVLIVVSILGATAMRSAAFQSKVSVNAQMTQIQFQGSESGLSSVGTLAQAQINAGISPQNMNHIFAKAYNGSVQRVCYDAAGTPVAYSDSQRVSIDNSHIAFTYPTACPKAGTSPVAVTTLIGRPPCQIDSQFSTQGYTLNDNSGFGDRALWVQSFTTLGGSAQPSSHVQLWLMKAPGSSSGCS